jgi:HEXXH motif-containing protein
LSFIPDHRHVRALKGRMHERIGDSLLRLAIAGETEAARWVASLRLAAEDIKQAGTLSPALFALYHDLMSAISCGEEEASEKALVELGGRSWRHSGLRIWNFSSECREPQAHDRYRKYLSVDPTTPMALMACPASEFDQMRRRCETALDLLEVADPELAAETREIVAEMIIAANDPHSSGSGDFSGASSFAIWGAIFLNAETHGDPVELAQAIVHEAAHLLLFAEAIDGPLVTNPESERFSSALRRDGRPMDGIYHATFVTGRMHYAAAAIHRNVPLDPTARRLLERTIAMHRRNFFSGLETIRGGARLTRLGETLLKGVEDHMSGSEAPPQRAGKS